MNNKTHYPSTGTGFQSSTEERQNSLFLFLLLLKHANYINWIGKERKSSAARKYIGPDGISNSRAVWHSLSELVNILNTARPSRTCQTLCYLFGTFQIHSNSTSSGSVFRNSSQPSAKFCNVKNTSGTFQVAAEPSKTFSQPHSSATLHFTQLKQLIITPAPSKVPPNFWEPDSPTFQKTHVWNPTKPGSNLHWNTKGQRPLLLRKYQIHMVSRRDSAGQFLQTHCSASRGNGGFWDAEKDLLEAFSICCLASQVVPDCWDAEKDLLEVFSICCPASAVRANIPTHRTLQQEAQSNSCFPNANRLRRGCRYDVALPMSSLSFLSLHQSLSSWHSPLVVRRADSLEKRHRKRGKLVVFEVQVRKAPEAAKDSWFHGCLRGDVS